MPLLMLPQIRLSEQNLKLSIPVIRDISVTDPQNRETIMPTSASIAPMPKISFVTKSNSTFVLGLWFRKKFNNDTYAQ